LASFAPIAKEPIAFLKEDIKWFHLEEFLKRKLPVNSQFLRKYQPI